MSCTNCALNVEKYLKKQGAENVHVDFSSGEADFELLAPEKNPNEIATGLGKIGYKVVSTEEDAEDSTEPSSGGLTALDWKLIAGAVFTLPLILAMFIPWAPLQNPWVHFGLATPVFLIGLQHFGVSAFNSIRAGIANMDILILMGSTAAYGYSLYGLLMGLGMDFMFFETAASIITIVLGGNLLEEKAVQRTTSSVRELSKLQNQKARKITSEDPKAGEISTEWVPMKALRVDDYVLLAEGDRVPADGEIIAGEGRADESHLTGESTPVEKSVGDNIISGSIIQSGNLRFRVTAAGADTTLSGIINLVKKAQSEKPAIQKLSDRISAIFVPAVIGIATLTFVVSVWGFQLAMGDALIHAIAVLVISCPCAMGLATPTAVVVGLGRAARQGILIKGATAFEQLKTIKTVVFDKTGTLTDGNFKEQGLRNFSDLTDDEVRGIIGAMEQYSSHPIAKALVKAYKGLSSPLELKTVTELKGKGLAAYTTTGDKLFLGKPKNQQQAEGAEDFNLWLYRNDEPLASLQIGDVIRSEAKQGIQDLKNRGLKVVLLSGDKEEKCQMVAAELGIDTVHAERSPAEKLQILQQLQEKGPVAMVGDGINDAPALAVADVGISLSSATAIANDAAQVSLLNADLSRLPKIFSIGDNTVTTIRQNLFWAFAYNVVAIPIAAIGLLTPMVGALAMAFSDLVVIGNSLRFKIKKA